ncbi:hypothetical protein ACSSNL_04440 [Thalassobius sp. S69A]|uniref:hypothetical protein n=1 Tax=unclassified Thalassovita TaxID=2619711 RepID=UPI003C7CD0FB
MTDRPINLTDWQVRAALDGRLSLVVEPLAKQPPESMAMYRYYGHEAPRPDLCHSFGWMVPEAGDLWPCNVEDRIPIRRATGDRLWVREAWRPSISAADPWHVAVLYPNDSKVRHWDWSSDDDFGDWIIPKAAAKGNISSQHMPRWASRLTLIVTDVRVMRVQEIGEDQAAATGLFKPYDIPLRELVDSPFRTSFQRAWNTRHSKRGLGWDANPWVTATAVTVHRCNIDQMEVAE